MKQTPIVLLAVLCILSTDCSNNEPQANTEFSSAELYTPKEINSIIYKKLQSTGDFNWKNADTKLLWSALVHGNHILSIGYGRSYDKTLKSTENNKIKTDLLNSIKVSEFSHNHELKITSKILYEDDENLTIVDVKITCLETLFKLLQSDNIRYMEPADYILPIFNKELKNALEMGCRLTGSTIHAADVTSVEPNCIASWTYSQHNIPQAWQHSRGEGITVGIIDTGISPYQPAMNKGFSNEYTGPRTIEKYGTFVNSPWIWSTKTDGTDDNCGHGSKMSATISAPLNDIEMPVGVAHKCNLVMYRASNSASLLTYHQQKGVANALTQLAHREDVKIISMSLGHIITINRIADAVRLAESKGKLVIAAGGTTSKSTNWLGVIFPARMKEVVSVTGIKDNGYEKCNICHCGNKIDFTIVMQRADDNKRNSVSLGYYEGDKSYDSGSSVATATTAGIAALVWAKYPNWTKDEVLNRLIQSSEFGNRRHPKFGYGNIDALKAVR